MEKIKKCKSCKADDLKLIYPLTNYDVLQCRECGLRFRDIRFDQSESNLLYNRKYFTEEQADYFFNNPKVKINDYTQRLDEIDKFRPKKGKLLDVGCAIGTFLNLALTHGYDVYGFEPSDFAADYARKKFKIKIFQGNFKENNFPDDHFDVVTMWDVVDHGEEPLELMKEVYKVIKKGGKLFIQTVVVDSLLFWLAHFMYISTLGVFKYPIQKVYPIHHSNYYSTKTLRKDIQRAGFSIISQKRVTLDHSLTSLGTSGKTAVWVLNKLAKLINKDVEARFIAEKN